MHRVNLYTWYLLLVYFDHCPVVGKNRILQVISHMTFHSWHQLRSLLTNFDRHTSVAGKGHCNYAQYRPSCVCSIGWQYGHIWSPRLGVNIINAFLKVHSRHITSASLIQASKSKLRCLSHSYNFKGALKSGQIMKKKKKKTQYFRIICYSKR